MTRGQEASGPRTWVTLQALRGHLEGAFAPAPQKVDPRSDCHGLAVPALHGRKNGGLRQGELSVLEIAASEMVADVHRLEPACLGLVANQPSFEECLGGSSLGFAADSLQPAGHEARRGVPIALLRRERLELGEGALARRCGGTIGSIGKLTEDGETFPEGEPRVARELGESDGILCEDGIGSLRP